jgi:hypothetical protein
MIFEQLENYPTSMEHVLSIISSMKEDETPNDAVTNLYHHLLPKITDYIREDSEIFKDKSFFSFGSWKERLEDGFPKRSYFSAVQYEDGIFVFGGNKEVKSFEESEELEEYSWNDMWSISLKDFACSKVKYSSKVVPKGRSDHTSVVYEDYMYIFGGSYDMVEETKSELFWRFHFPTKSWNKMPLPKRGKFPRPRKSHTACVYKVFIRPYISLQRTHSLCMEVRLYMMTTILILTLLNLEIFGNFHSQLELGRSFLMLGTIQRQEKLNNLFF